MAYLNGTEREKFVNRTFTDIAPRYVFMNHLMTGGMDIVLRRETARIAGLKPGESALDLGTGTGDLAREIRRRYPHASITASDFNLAMMTATKDWGKIDRVTTDALKLPYADSCFDVVLSGYLVRNVSSLETALSEQFRVLRPGGRLVILDTTKPRRNFFTPFINFYFKRIIPVLGLIFNRNREAYTYLTESTQNFISAEDLVSALRKAGFVNIQFRIRMFGTMAIHSALKPNLSSFRSSYGD